MNRVSAYLGDYTYLSQLAHGPKIFLDTRELSMTAHIISDGFWESWITDVFLQSIHKGMSVLDIGANCGYYSLLAASVVGPTGQVHAFEPNPFHHINLNKSKMINGFYHLDIHPHALSNENGEMDLFVPKNLTASASLFGNLIKPIEKIDTIEAVPVTTVKLSEYLPNVKANVIKMDIEGAEPLILDDVLDIMDRTGDSTLIMEYNQKAWEMQDFDYEKIMNNVDKRGFNIHIIQHDRTLQPVSPKELIKAVGPHTHFDLFITRK
ncbi:FkbM family methyltransferase [Bacillus weihaiensis]|uniref:Methyltransferase FkbM domain-containing protein n=1 Tax=Bacillus weihaiensis TaxID=1547283 RepID=A0A1L3MW83_9BACI|nr:FkbM family methyltransferase [Bacillus weihaiensis]APH06597.1 hypothetical protein A9C19_18825 [Bacillus weihaiensis]